MGLIPASSRFSKLTPRLIFSCFALAFGAVLFGYDTSSFGGIQAAPGFVNTFGRPNAKGKYAIDTTDIALMTSLAFVGKGIGCLASGTLIERFGHRVVFVILAVVSYIGIILELTSSGSTYGTGRVPQIIVGRIIVYVAVGLVEVTITTYQSETAPAVLRGFITQSLQLFLGLGTIIASVVNKVLSTRTDESGWKIVFGIQFIFPTVIIACLPFIPDSPRWLISKGRDEEAIKALRSIRPQSDVNEGRCEDEIYSIKELLHQDVGKAPWLDLIRKGNFRRTTLVLVMYSFQQLTGTHFAGVYQTTFYKQNGYADKAFTYPIITSCLGVLSPALCMFLFDIVGRRPMFITSGLAQGFFLFLLAGLGSMANPTSASRNTVVAAFMLFAFSYNLGWGAGPYLSGSEIPRPALREKTQAVGTTVNVFWAWFTTYTMPYIINAWHFKIGYLYGALSCLAAIFAFTCLPETKGFALEELEPLFDHLYNPFRPPMKPNEHHLTDLENEVGAKPEVVYKENLEATESKEREELVA